MPPIVVLTFAILAVAYVYVSVVEVELSRKWKVKVLEASALHYIRDPLITIAVLTGVYLSAKGYWLLDIAITVGIVVLLIISSVKVLSEASWVLLDRAVLDVAKIKRVVEAEPDIVSCREVRSRTDSRRSS